MLSFISRYPSVCTKVDKKFPTGIPYILYTKKELEKVRITANGSFYGDQPIGGMAHVKIKATPTYYPFLQYRYLVLIQNCFLKNRCNL